MVTLRRYEEILKLKKFCDKHKIKHTFMPLYDGWKILFENHDDCIQHYGSHNHDNCIEFLQIKGCGIKVLSLDEAKEFVLKHYA